MILRIFTACLLFLAFNYDNAFCAEGAMDYTEPPAEISASLDRTEASIGDTVILKIGYRVPENVDFKSDVKLEGLEGFTVVDRRMKDGEIILKLIVDRIDKFEIGPLSLSYVDKEGIETMVRSEPVSLKVLSNLGDKPAEAQLKPIMDIEPITPLWLKYFPWILGFLALCGAAAGFYWWRKRKGRLEEALALKPPHVEAQDEIRKLQASRLFEKGQYKEFYFRLSEIIRKYIEKIRGFPAAEFTTEEIARRLKDDQDRRMLPLLRESDMVKFADAIPTEARKDENLREALSYIQDTAPSYNTLEEEG